MSALLAPRKRDTPLVEGEYALTSANFARIAAFMRDTTGIALTESKATLVYSRLAKRLRLLGLADFDAYCAYVETAAGARERNEMMAALTTNLTRFFREPHHFDYLRTEIVPKLAAAARQGGRVRLWSAACSSGEEPYSIALTLLEAFPEAARHDVKILATDIDPNVVARGRAGVYGDAAVAPIPNAMRQRWMMQTQQGGDSAWSVKDEVRALITFKELNLIGDWPMRGRFDVIFCRNVVIYFEESTQAKLWTRFKNVLTPAGRLIIGHSERIDVSGFESAGLTIYKQMGAA